MKPLFLLIALFSCVCVEATEWCFNWKKFIGPQHLTVGPEVLYLRRTRDLGTVQKGVLYGFHGTYERMPHNGIYLAVDSYWVYGNMAGHNSSSSLRSRMWDAELEGRAGITFCVPVSRTWLITPYAGVGHIWNKNDFSQPAATPLTFFDHINYTSGGLMTQFYPCKGFSIGLLVDVKWLYDGKSRVSDDPFEEDLTLLMSPKLAYTIEIPFSYQFLNRCNRRFQAHFTPFFRYRHLGGREGSPQDFLTTKLYFWGARAAIVAVF